MNQSTRYILSKILLAYTFGRCGLAQAPDISSQQAIHSFCSNVNINAKNGSVTFSCSNLTPAQQQLIATAPSLLNKLLRTEQKDAANILGKLNRVLAFQNSSEELLKQLEKALEDLQSAKAQPLQNNNAPGGMIITGGVNTNPTVNNYGVSKPPPHVTWTAKPSAKGGVMEGPVADHPGVEISLTVSDTFSNPMFAVQCDRPCVGTNASTPGVSSPQFLSTNSPQVAVLALGVMTGFVAGGSPVSLRVRSGDLNPIQVVNVTACIFSTDPNHAPGAIYCSN